MEKQNTPRVINWIQIPESELVGCAEDCVKQFGDKEENMFQKVIDSGVIFKEAGLTPLFFMSSTFSDVMVAPREYVERRITLH